MKKVRALQLDMYFWASHDSIYTLRQICATIGEKFSDFSWPGNIGEAMLLRLRGGASQDRQTASGIGLIEKFQTLHKSIERKRLELCPWEQFGIECEEAFAYQQVGLARPRVLGQLIN
jgi:hypothetical protein